jgi:hypothetical protein
MDMFELLQGSNGVTYSRTRSHSSHVHLKVATDLYQSFPPRKRRYVSIGDGLAGVAVSRMDVFD